MEDGISKCVEKKSVIFLKKRKPDDDNSNRFFVGTTEKSRKNHRKGIYRFYYCFYVNDVRFKRVVVFAVFIKECCLWKCTEINFMDSTTLKMCKNQRINSHNVFKGLVERGKSSMGWFYGFKLHLVCNEKGKNF